MSKHTPGPWDIELFNDKWLVFADADCEVHEFAAVYSTPSCRLPDEAEANARLIAEAPTMLDLLERIGERCIRENPDNVSERYAIEPDIDPDMVEEILALLSKLGRHP